MKATSSKSKTNKEDNCQGGTNCKHCRKEIILQKNANSSMLYAINVTNKDTLPLFVNLQRNLKFMQSRKNSQILKKTIEQFDDYLYLYNIQGGSENPIMIEIEIENQPVCTEFDTWSGKSVISENLYKDKFSNLPLKQSRLIFVTYIQWRKSSLLDMLTYKCNMEVSH